MVPRSGTLRPTSDRVKESLFSALGDRRLVGARVLDLYAGTGALAIEAISRGADAAVLVERDPAAVAAITENLAVLGMSGRARVLRRDVAAFLAAPPAPEAPFDLVLVDPPYATAPTAVSGVLAALAMPAWVTADATVVVEGPAGDGPSWPPGWVSTWHRCYGDTLLCFGNTIEEKP